MSGERDLFGAPINWDARRGRPVTPKNRGTGYTPEQRRAEQSRWWGEHMQDVFPQFASDFVTATGAGIASRSGLNVVDVGAEMAALESLSAIRSGLAASIGLAITSEELVDAVLREARVLERSSGISHLATSLSALVVENYLQVRAEAKKSLGAEKSQALRNRIYQRRLPQF